VNFKQIQPQRPGRFSNALQRWARLFWYVFVVADIEYPFEYGDVINYTLDGVSIHPVTTKIQASFLTNLPERKEFHHEANSDFKNSYKV
jgi:hypothetical protein